MAGIRATYSAFLVVVLGVAALSVSARAADERAPLLTDGSLVFVTKSDACDCVATLCVAGEQEVLNFLSASGAGLRYQRVDLAEDPDAGKTYGAVTLPVALLIDGAGDEIGRFDSFFTEAQLTGVWQHHLAAQGKQP